jgi:hypothetical protein
MGFCLMTVLGVETGYRNRGYSKRDFSGGSEVTSN